MMMPFSPGPFVISVFLLALPFAPAPVLASCDDLAVSGPTSLSLSDPYNPFAQGELSQGYAITILNEADAPCDALVMFTTTDGGKLRSGEERITYMLETLGGAALLNPPSIMAPASANALPLSLGALEAASFNVRARVPPGQMAQPGQYIDPALALRVYADDNAPLAAPQLEQAFALSADVAAVCAVAAPQPGTLDFSDDIGPDARPEGIARIVHMPEAACNTAARLRLAAPALAHEDAGSLSGFDTFIDFEADATFGTIAASLTTNGPDTAATALSGGATPQDGASGDINLHVRLSPARPLAAGAYSSILTIALEPSP